jgi:hypothetical protein
MFAKVERASCSCVESRFRHAAKVSDLNKALIELALLYHHKGPGDHVRILGIEKERCVSQCLPKPDEEVLPPVFGRELSVG